MGWRHKSGRAELPRGEERDRALGLTPSTSEISCLGGGGKGHGKEAFREFG